MVLTPVSGGESGCSVIAGHCGYYFIAPANCPPETGETRSEATEGVDKTNHYYLLLFHPLPTAWYSPLSQGEKVDARVLQEYCDYIFTATADCPPETGETRSEVTEGLDKTNHYYLDYLSTPSPLRGTPPVSGGESGCSAIARTLSPLFPVVTIPISCRGVGGRVRLAEGLGRVRFSFSCKGIGGGAVFRSSFYCMIFCITFGIYGNCITFA